LLLLAGDRQLEVQKLQLNFQEAGSRERLFALPWSRTVGINCAATPKVCFLILGRKSNVSLTQAGAPAMGTLFALTVGRFGATQWLTISMSALRHRL
jgi:hypothetical protein